MGNQIDLQILLNEIAEKVKKGECILFLGAGVHAPPSGTDKYEYRESDRPLTSVELSKKIAGRCGFEKKFPNEPEISLQRTSLCFEMTPALGRKALIDEIKKAVHVEKKPSPCLDMLAEMPFRIIVSTNYDHLFETSLQKFHKDYKRIVYEPESHHKTEDIYGEPPAPESPLVYKMHGDIDKAESIVITDEDYITFIQRMSENDAFHPIPETVRFCMQKWSILFIGYSLRDYNLRLLFRTLRWKIDPANFPPSFSVDKNPDPLIMQVLQDEQHIVAFVTNDIWWFVPQLHRKVVGGSDNE